jgi:hypothetical protein
VVNLRLNNLMDLDPLSVPLPNGTEVTTRVEQLWGDRRVPQGCVGRVLRSDGEMLEVAVAGVGTLRFRRQDVIARKAGQLRFAQRRAWAWEALRPCVVLEAVVGSRAWGLADDGSDTDVRGVMVLPFPWTVALQPPPTELVSADGSTTFWDVRKAAMQGLRADPNTLEMLFVDGVKATDEMGQWLLDIRDAFVSQRIHGTFGRYALSQLKKLSQSLRLAEHRTLVLEWLQHDATLTLDAVAARLARHTLDEADEANATLRAKTYIKQLTRSLHDQGLIAGADFQHLRTLAHSEALTTLPRELRPKNAYNLLRLILTATHWLRTGEARLQVPPSERPALLAIKQGLVPLPEVLRQAEALTEGMEEALRNSPLPRDADVARVDAMLRRVGGEAARRFVSGAPGPYGGAGVVPPPATWEDATQDEEEKPA